MLPIVASHRQSMFLSLVRELHLGKDLTERTDHLRWYNQTMTGQSQLASGKNYERLGVHLREG
jgi:hypothetical protein